MYGGAQEDLASKLKALQEENLALRNKVLSSNEQIFELQASIMTSEAEAKYYVETEMKKLQSETNFRNKEFANLNREHQAVLKELVQAKQALKTNVSSGNNTGGSSSNVITPSQLARTVSAPAPSTINVATDRVSTTTSSEQNVANADISNDSKQSSPKKDDRVVHISWSQTHLSSFLMTQFHSLLMSLSSIDVVSASTNFSLSSTGASGSDEVSTPRSNGKVKSTHSSTRLSPTSLLKLKSTVQKVNDNNAIEECWGRVNELVALISDCFYGFHSEGGADLTAVLVHLLALCRALLTIAQTKIAAAVSQSSELVSKEFTSVHFGLSLIFSVLSHLEDSVPLSVSSSQSNEVAVVGNLSNKFEQVAAASSLPREDFRGAASSLHKGTKRKIEAVVRDTSDASAAQVLGNEGNSSSGNTKVLGSIKLPGLSKEKINSLGKTQEEAASSRRSGAGSKWASDFCSLCSDIIAVCSVTLSEDQSEQIVKVLIDIQLVLFQRSGINLRSCLSCLTSSETRTLVKTSAAAPAMPAVLSVLMMKNVALECKSDLMGVLSRVLTDSRVFHEVVQDEDRRLASSVAAIVTSTGSESGRSGTALTVNNTNNREVDEEERMPTTSTDGGELHAKAAAVGGAGAADKEFLHVITGLLVCGCHTRDGLILQNKIVMLLQDLLSCHGCQFISWLVGRPAEDVLSSAGEIRTSSSRLSEAMEVVSTAPHRHVSGGHDGHASSAAAGGSSSLHAKTPNVKRGNGAITHEGSDLLTPLPSSAVTPGSAGSVASHVKLPVDFQSFAENDAAIDRVCINRLIDALKTSTRLLDTWRQSGSGSGSINGSAVGEQKLHCLLVHRLVNLFNSIAGRMTPNDWSLLIAERNDFINAFLNRSYVNRLHPDIIIRSEQIEYLDRECD